MLLIIAFFTSYMLQMKKVTAIHETVISIFAGTFFKPPLMRSMAYTYFSHRNGCWTHPFTILAIFNTYKVDPKLYTIIFGESILNDAIAIVIFETAQKYKKGEAAG